jgi:hypothetical protein
VGGAGVDAGVVVAGAGVTGSATSRATTVTACGFGIVIMF